MEITSVKLAVDSNGLDANGRMVAYFGSPRIDGEIDSIWKKAPKVIPQYASTDQTTATFQALWDDDALYILAVVKDAHLSAQSDTLHNQDSVEIFLDEHNDKSEEYGVDDLHIRINYKNSLSADVGNTINYYTAAKITEDGYIIEARIALKQKPENGKVLGIELQVNDAMGEDRVGSIHVFDSTGQAWNNPSTFGEIILVGKTKQQESGSNPYDLINLIKHTTKMDFTRYKNPSIVMDTIGTISERTLLIPHISQQEMDTHYHALTKAISELELTEEAVNEKYFEPVPDDYRIPCANQGTIQTLHYDTPNLDNGIDKKKLHVYLPYGYDASNSSKQYNVLYLMHGGGENEDLIFGGPGENKELKNILDNRIAKGDIEPLIVVTPTIYGGKGDPASFHEELIHDIVPLVETTYHTYANIDDLQASRAHRAFGGFSMGSVTTWHLFTTCLDYFKYYLPLCGDSWALGLTGGGKMPTETAAYIADAARTSGYAPEDYYIFSATGDKDIAYPNLKPQIDAMKELTDVFHYSSDTEKGNFYFIVADGGTHSWYWVNQYIYDILPDLFKK
ncbi:sugar-binding protein [Gracilibacillus marinus]|uniref:Sugar-binding protein n=1 Tax=Gracilibacillus marinus TaxID=630535 RepID=A0ABV8VW65_9BACI